MNRLRHFAKIALIVLSTLTADQIALLPHAGQKLIEIIAVVWALTLDPKAGKKTE